MLRGRVLCARCFLCTLRLLFSSVEQSLSSCELYTQGHNGHLDWWVPPVITSLSTTAALHILFTVHRNLLE
ncbi:hypothetical protein PVAP13_5NG118808 [Panicum virgatum]|uniref:Uncharacterized protein n=1 Tax=Panicum virgatum TaxID=38727 RepID=A0A8T0RM91_PANVG|nr:hypothetical protein PVAP13_5NG118808 [Panicum virgatum]